MTQKLVDWLQQRPGFRATMTAMLHRLRMIRKNIKKRLVSIFQLFILTATGNISVWIKKECLIAAS